MGLVCATAAAAVLAAVLPQRIAVAAFAAVAAVAVAATVVFFGYFALYGE